MMKLEYSSSWNESFDTSWSLLINSSLQPSWFQTPSFFRFALQSGYFTPSFAFIKKGDSWVALLLWVDVSEDGFVKRYLSSRTIVQGNPLLSKDLTLSEQSEALTLLLSNLVEKTQRTSLYIQVRNSSNTEYFASLYQKFRFKFSEHINLIKPTFSAKEVLSGMSESRRRQIKKALNSNAEIIKCPTPLEFTEFYGILSVFYRSKVKKPLPPLSFFLAFLKNCQNPDFGIIHLVKYDGQIIGGIVCPLLPGATLYEWYIYGLDSEFPEAYPSILVTWSALNYAVQKKIPFFDFMGMGNPKQPYGVREFKSRFGGETVNYGRYERINNIPVYLFAYGLFKVFNWLNFSKALYRERKK